ncbi:MAG: uroporphyrinogen-III decarboxylase-like protein [Candidatus Aminicenantes bacterium RBG_13_63_10]|nr:MAG: uroporphyrinogen-III decarboxylase-like protein [Candidatus Aminicenantes bacterium RBG_13_63_10]
MTSKERWQAVLNRAIPDRVPMDYWGTDEATARLMKHLGCSTKRQALEKLEIDFVIKLRPSYIGPRLPRDGDVFGCLYREVDYGSGFYRECSYSPLADFESVEEIEGSYRWPEPDWWDCGSLPSQLEGNEMYPVEGGGSEPFLDYKNLRGETQAFIDLVEHPDIAAYCLDKLFGLSYELTRRVLETVPGAVTYTYIAEDLGGQSDLLISPEHIRRFLLPGMKRMIELSHQAGAAVFHHDDGNCRRILADLVQAGIDILNPVQWRAAGMDRESLKDEYGPRLVFHGGMDNQRTLPFGSVDDVRREVEDNLRLLGRGGGYILAPCHNIQSITPAENIVAMYDACLGLGRT